MRIATQAFVGIAFSINSGISTAHKLPQIPAEKRYSDKTIVDCIRSKTGPIDKQMDELKRQESNRKRARTSIETVVLERRRLEEKYCQIEARCLADAIPRHREHFYGLTLSTCLDN